jgi:hypothetical protein
VFNKPENYTSNTLSVYHFYSEELFTEISNYIGKDQKDYRVGNIGLHPAVARHNGFYTIDGYSNLYNLDHKNKIESIISQELSKNNLLNNKFRYAGFRCYLFTSELYDIWNHKDKIISKNRNLSISQPEFNYTILKSLPCHYLMSTVKIELSENTPLNFLQSFEKDKLPYRIYLYELI